MKRICTAVLALALAVPLSVPAFAENADTNIGIHPTTTEVTGRMDPGKEAPESVVVDVVWEKADFTYTVKDKKVWQPGSHSYSNPDGQWTANECSFTVTNRSNVDIEATFGFESDQSSLSWAFDAEKLELPTIKDSGATTPKAGTVNFRLTNGFIEKYSKLGTITVTVEVPKITEVATEEELAAALSAGSKIRLNGDIALENKLLLRNFTGDIDLNGHTLSCAADTAVYALNCKVTIQNGTLASQAAGDGYFVVRADANSSVSLKNCTLNAGGNVAVQLVAGTVDLADCTINCDSYYAPIKLMASYNIGSVLTVSGKTTIQTKSYSKVALEGSNTVKFEAGTYNFDPSAYVNTDSYTVTEDSGVWTVAAKQ